MFATLLSAVSWTPGVHTLGWCRAPVLRTASLLLSANSASMGGDEVQPVSLDGFFSFFNTLSAAFNRFDLDGDGTITTAEIGAVLRECGETPSDGEVAQLVAQFDDNNNGTVDFDEFCALVTRSRSDSVNSQVESKVAEIAREAIATDEGAAGAPLQQTGADGGMAKTDAVEHLGAQLHAQANTRERQAQSAGFGGVVELIARPGDKECERIRSTLASLGIGADKVREVSTEDSTGVEVRVVGADGSSERVEAFWMEVGAVRSRGGCRSERRMHAHGQGLSSFNRGRMYASARVATPSVAASVAALTRSRRRRCWTPGTVRRRSAARRSSASPGRRDG